MTKDEAGKSRRAGPAGMLEGLLPALYHNQKPVATHGKKLVFPKEYPWHNRAIDHCAERDVFARTALPAQNIDGS